MSSTQRLTHKHTLLKSIILLLIVCSTWSGLQANKVMGDAGSLLNSEKVDSIPILNPIEDLAAFTDRTSFVEVTANGVAEMDTLAFTIQPALPPFATFTANGQLTATLAVSPTDSDVGDYGDFIVTVTDGEFVDQDTFRLTVVTGPAACVPLSVLGCEEIVRDLPISLDFEGLDGGIGDTTGVGTGFSMLLPPSFNIYPPVPFEANVPGYEPDLLNVEGGNLNILTTKGHPIETGDIDSERNSQVNMLGVGYELPGSAYDIRTDITQPSFASSDGVGQFAGLWFGIDEDNFIRLNVTKSVTRSQRVELTIETTDPTDSTRVVIDQILSSGLNSINPASIELRLEVDPIYKSVRAFYTFNGGGEASLQRDGIDSLILPDVFLSGFDHDSSPATANILYGGVLASHRQATPGSELEIEFRSFGIEVQPFVPALLLSANTKDLSLVEGATSDTFLVSAFTNNSTVPMLTATVDPVSPWLTFPDSVIIGENAFQINSGLATGEYSATVNFSAPNYVSTSLEVNVLVSSVSSVPRVLGSTPANGEANVSLSATVSANDLFVPNDVDGVFGVDNNSITNNVVKLFRVSDNLEIPSTVNGTGGGDAINLTPNIPLEINTTYRFEIDGVRDLSGVAFEPFSATFTTAAENSSTATALDNVSFTSGGDVATEGLYTSLEVGPDGKFYGLQLLGQLDRWTIAADGSLIEKETITSLVDEYGPRTAIGLAFPPDASATNLSVYISHAEGVLTNGQPWDGKISRLSGPDLAKEDLVVTHLPRSRRDHVVNSLAFRPGTNDLFFSVGSNTAGGAPDNSWGRRLERILTAATLKLDLDLLPEAQWPLDARTTMDQNAINNVDVNSPTLGTGTGEYFESGDTFPDLGTYNPFYVNAPLTIFATGIRNAYDLVWHSNGQLYIPTNGTAGGSNSPQSVPGTRRISGETYDTDGNPTLYPDVPPTFANNTQRDFLFRVDPTDSLGYFGHPNPLRGEFVLNRGPVDVRNYPNNVAPDPNYRGIAFDFGFNKSPNGVVEYTSNAEGGNLRGAILVTRYSNSSDIIALVPNGPNGDILTSRVRIPGFTGFSDPLDITEDKLTGNLYVSDLSRQSIVLLRPSDQAEPEPIVDITPNEVVTDDVVGFGPGDAITIFISNSGNAPLNDPVVFISGEDRSEFTVEATNLGATLERGNSVTVTVRFDPETVGPKNAVLSVDGSNSDATSINLIGYGLKGFDGDNEPSLQQILDLYQIPIDVADEDPESAVFDLAENRDYNDLIGDEIYGQLFRAATFENINIEVLSVFSTRGLEPILGFGWYQAGDINTTDELFVVPNDGVRNAQTVAPIINGALNFNPGDDIFGFFGRWSVDTDRYVYSEDDLNTFPGAVPHQVRIYEVPNVDNTYILAIEGHNGSTDYQDIVLKISNVEPLTEPRLPQASFSPDHLYPESFDNGIEITGDTVSLNVMNTGNNNLRIDSIQFTGRDSALLAIVAGSFPLTIAPAAAHEYDIHFLPVGNEPYDIYEANVVFYTNTETSQFSVPLSGLLKAGISPEDEPSLSKISEVLNLGINIGWDGLTTDSSTVLRGDEILIDRFVGADAGAVKVTPLARYSAVNTLSYGAYSPNDGVSNVTELDNGVEDNQTLFPGRSTVHLSEQIGFNLYVEVDGTTFFANDSLNTGGLPRTARVYQVNTFGQKQVENTYLIAFDLEGNVDYQDMVFLLENATPYLAPQPRIVFRPDNLNLVAARDVQTTFDKAYTLRLENTEGVDAQDAAEIYHSASWLSVPDFSNFFSFADVTIDATGLLPGVYETEIIAVFPGLISDTLPVSLVVRESQPNNIHVNFQDRSFQPPLGYFADYGEAFGPRYNNAFQFGWLDPFTLRASDNTDAAQGAAFGTTDADSRSDKLVNSFVELEIMGLNTPHIWEMALNNGLYVVRVAAGEPDAAPGIHTVFVEDKSLITGFEPTAAGRFQIATDTVRVSDGLLSITEDRSIAGANTKLMFVDITPVDSSSFIPLVFADVEGNATSENDFFGAVTVSLRGVDQSGSGRIAAIRYRINGGDFQLYSEPFVLDTINGEMAEYFIEFDATDQFGNIGFGNRTLTVSPASGSVLRIENMTKIINTDIGFPADDWYAFNQIGFPRNFDRDTALVNKLNWMRIHNDGVDTMLITQLTTEATGDFVVNYPVIPEGGLEVPPGEFVDAEIEVVTDQGTKRLIQQELILLTNADNSNKISATLSTLYSARPEGNNEHAPEVILSNFGYSTSVGVDEDGRRVGPNSFLPAEEDVNSGALGDRVLSQFFVQADPTDQLTLMRLASFQGPKVARGILLGENGRTAGGIAIATGRGNHQSILPKRLSGSTVVASDFARSVTSPFTISIENLRLTGTLNSAQDTVYGVAVFKALDRNGEVIPNTFFFLQDNVGDGCITQVSGRCDFNDNIDVIFNARPVEQPFSKGIPDDTLSILEEVTMDLGSYFDRGYAGNSLKYSGFVLGGNALPVYTSIDATTGSFVINPPFEAAGDTLSFVITATDENLQVVNDTFNIFVRETDITCSVDANVDGNNYLIDCSTPAVQLHGFISTGSYVWEGPAGFTASDSTPIVTVPGSYTLRDTTQSNNCPIVSTVMVEQGQTAPLITIVAPINTLNCSRPDLQVLAAVDDPSANVVWSDGAGDFITDENIFTASLPGVYTVMSTNSAGCISTDSVEIFLDTTPQTAGSGGVENVCGIPGTLSLFELLQSSGGNPDEGGTWSFGGGSITEIIDPGTSVSGDYEYTVGGAHGCSTESATLSITFDEPTAYFSDADFDGFGDPNEVVLACSVPDGFVLDNSDNCPNTGSNDLTDTDGDGMGDLCDEDDDNDGVEDDLDCDPLDASVLGEITYYSDVDGDGLGDPNISINICGDPPANFVIDNTDNCPSTFNPDQQDTDRDGKGDACDPSPLGRFEFWLEAECAEVGATWVSDTSTLAGNGEFVFSNVDGRDNPPADLPENYVRFTIDNVEGGTYHIFARILARDAGRNSYWIRYNRGPWVLYTREIVEGPEFNWSRLVDSPLELVDGQNVIDFASREAQTLLDKIHLNTTGVRPIELGSPGTNCGNIPNIPPVANAVVSPQVGPGPLTIQLDGTQSFDENNFIIEYKWNFANDSLFGINQQAVLGVGIHPVVLTVLDEDGDTDTDTVFVEVFDGNADTDGDGILDRDDNCFTFFNPDQQQTTFYADFDGDGFGDPSVFLDDCEAPLDFVANRRDNCPTVFSTNLIDSDGDGMGDLCDGDDDNDGVLDEDDCSPLDPTAGLIRAFYADNDNDGFGDPGDSIMACKVPVGYVENNSDNCPDITNVDQSDFDQDGIGDVCDASILGISSFSLEAECASVGFEWTTGSDEGIEPGGEYVTYLGPDFFSQPPNDIPQNRIRFIVDDVQPGAYKLYTRTGAPTGSENSYWVSVNGSSYVRYDTPFDTDEVFQWSELPDNDYELNDGRNVVDFLFREAETLLDKVYLTKEGDVPTSTGSPSDNCIDVPNILPEAIALTEDTLGMEPFTVDLDGSESNDPDGVVISYSWDWGVGTTTEIEPRITLMEGVYNVVLTVTDDEGATAMDTVQITVSFNGNDADGDGVRDIEDNCPDLFNPDQFIASFFADLDGDGLGDPNAQLMACTQPEGYVSNSSDNCPETISQDTTDTDGDGIGNVCDSDDDNDGVADINDCDPLNAAIAFGAIYYRDADGDGLGDPNLFVNSCEIPFGFVADGSDNCPDVYNPDQRDFDFDGIGDVCDDEIAGINEYYLEAECAQVGAAWSLGSDTAASNAEYQVYRGPSSNAAPPADDSVNYIRFIVDINESEEYFIFGRIRSTSPSEDSYWIRANQGPWIQRNSLTRNGGFVWNDLFRSGQYFAAGTNTIDIAYREPHAELDKIFISQERPLPSGFGPIGLNCQPNNFPPVALARATPDRGPFPLRVRLNGNDSYATAPEGEIRRYKWLTPQNDGVNLFGAEQDIILRLPGVYEIPLVVTDNVFSTDTAYVTVTVLNEGADTDGDGLQDNQDNCPTVFNPDQVIPTYYADFDGDGFGDPDNTIFSCEPPLNYVANNVDNCPDTFNPNQLDTDNDGLGDACDDDDDGDGVADENDCAPLNDLRNQFVTFFEDIDGDGFGDPDVSVVDCSPPPGFVDNGTDNCIFVANPSQRDDDGDGIGNACDLLPRGQDTIYLEAECAIVGSAWRTMSDNEASNQQFVVYNGSASAASPPADLPENHVTFFVDNVIGGDYRMYGLVEAFSASGDSYWIRVNQGSWIARNTLDRSGTYTWNDILRRTVSLADGNNRIDVAYREPGAKLDKILLYQSSRLPVEPSPTGNNCGSVSSRPVAIASGTPVVSIAPTTITLDGTESYDIDDNGSIVGYQWEWNGGTSQDSITQITLTNPGEYEVTLTVTDNTGDTDTDIFTLTVEEEPTSQLFAVAQATPDRGPSPLNTQLDGTGSLSGETTIISYEWEWRGGSASGGQVPVVFTTGFYDVTLTVTNNRGEVSRDSVRITSLEAFDDTDEDGIADLDDNCPAIPNPDQFRPTFYEDLDGDGLGDRFSSIVECEAPPGFVSDSTDNCPTVFGSDLTDTDGDGLGDICDPDDDNDGIADDLDCGPLDSLIGGATVYYADFDGDGIGDSNNSMPFCEEPLNYVLTIGDNCPDTFNPGQEDADGDGIGDACDLVPFVPRDVWLEAECATVGSNWATQSDLDASNEAYVVYPSSDTTASVSSPSSDIPENLLTFTIDNIAGGLYYVFVRTSASSSSSDSYFIRANGGDWVTRNSLNTNGAYVWRPMFFRGVQLGNGTNTIEFTFRETDTRIDKVFVSQSNQAPDGIGPESENCFEPVNMLPVAIAESDTLEGTAPLTLNLDGSESFDSDGQIVAYDWFYAGDSTSGALAQIQLPTPGVQSVILRITDNFGGTDFDTLSITVNEPANLPPMAIASASPSSGVDSLVTFLDARNSTDSDGTVTSYMWEWPGNTATTDTVSADFGLGTFDVKLTVTDDDGAVDSTVITVSVVESNGDTDGDGIPNDMDNCPTVFNPGQELTTYYEDLDNDGLGDPNDSLQACTLPDGYVSNNNDLCPDTFSPENNDTDNDGIGDVCDDDIDGDGVLDVNDCDPLDSLIGAPITYFADFDGDGLGDTNSAITACESPTGYVTVGGDNCPAIANPTQEDADGDGLGDACDDMPFAPRDIWLEAECATVGSAWVTESDDAASNDEYVVYPSSDSTASVSSPSPDDPENLITFNLENVAAGEYYVFVRTSASGSSSDSYFIRANGGAWVTRNSLNTRGDYLWRPMFFRGVQLQDGSNTIDITFRETNTRIDKVIVSLSNVAPEGEGPESENCLLPINTSPVAIAASDSIEGVAPFTLNLDGTASFDPDTNGEIEAYDWFFEGDSTSGALTQIQLVTPGVQQVVLRVTDNQGATDFDTLSVTVNEPPNQAPSALANASPSTGADSLTTLLDGRNSSDADGTIVSYLWEWSGNALSGDTVTASFGLGTFNVVLTVTDEDGAQDSDTITIEVLESNADTDNDGVPNSSDNCPTVFNPDQALTVYYRDADADGFGDPNDSILACTQIAGYVNNNQDNCPNTFSTSLVDTDGDGLGDVCDPDDDNDGVFDHEDCAPLDSTASMLQTYYRDVDQDGYGIAEDDTLACIQPVGFALLAGDNCPHTANPNQSDVDGDGLGDACDPSPEGLTEFWLEAECAIVGDEWTVMSDTAASNGSYAVHLGPGSSTPPADIPENQLKFIVDGVQDGVYYLYQRISADNSSEDSYFFRINGGPWQQRNSLNSGGAYLWRTAIFSSFPLMDGTNIIEVSYREPNARMDKLLLTNELGVPEGLGDLGGNCSNSTVDGPIAVAAVSPAIGPAPLTVTLDGRTSSPGATGDTILSYDWTINGLLLSGDSLQTTLSSIGTFEAILTITDESGVSDTDTIEIIVTGPDSDGDGVPDDTDNCPDMPNPDQLDDDNDGIGDSCDPVFGDAVTATLEAECATIGQLFDTIVDLSASGNTYISTTTGDSLTAPADTNSVSVIRFDTELNEAGDYKVFVRFDAPSVTSNSFYVRVDEGPWDLMMLEADGSPLLTNGFEWRRTSDSTGAQLDYPLLAGLHTIRIAHREAGVRFDKVYITRDTLSPTGNGPIDEDCYPITKAHLGAGEGNAEETQTSLTQMNEFQGLLELRVFPNPVIQRLNVELANDYEGEIDMVVLDLNGRILRHRVLQKSTGLTRFTVEVENLPEGTYMIQVISGDTYQRKLFIKGR